jgi:hypothetical protein
MQEFLRIRVAIDSLIDQTKLSIKEKSIPDSMQQIDQARELIQKLKQISTSDQDTIVAKRESTIEALAINAGLIKKGSSKKKTKEKVATPLETS